jgi:two-component system sensor histidine kinase DctS
VPSTTTPPPRRRTRRAAAWLAALALALLLIGLAAQWAATREANFQADSIRRAMEVHVLGLRDSAGKYSYLPFTTGLHPEVLAALAHPQDADVKQRANLYIEEVNRQAGSDALYLIDLNGLTLAASNWATPQSFVGESYANRPYFIDARAGRGGMFYGVGQTTGEPGLFISAPVRARRRRGAGRGHGQGQPAPAAGGLDLRARPDPAERRARRGVPELGAVVALPDAQRAGPRRARARAARPAVRRAQRLPGAAMEGGAKRRAAGLPGAHRHRRQAAPLPGRRRAPARPGLDADGDGRPRRGDPRARAHLDAGPAVRGRAAAGRPVLALRERRFAEQRDARRDLELRVRERTHALDEAHAFRKAMEDSLLVGMRARDREGRITYVNPAFCDMTGYGAGELLGKLPPYPYWHPDDVPRHWHHYDAMMSGQPARSGFESRLRHRDGHEVITMVYTAPLIDADGAHSGWMSSVVDITEQKRAELRQRQNDEQLQHAQRLASLGEMASTLAHELNQPLMALSNFASAAKAFAEQGNQQLLVSSLDETMAQAQRSAEIVRRIRGFVRQRTVGTEDCAVSALVANALALLQGEMRQRQARAEVRMQPGLPPVRGDRVLLEQVLLNLLSNSLQAMQATPPEQRVVEIEAERLGARMHIRVADRGAGIDAALAEQVFAPFFTTKPGGLGLGLNICRTIVEAHRGRLSFADRPGGGTVFTLELEIPSP